MITLLKNYLQSRILDCNSELLAAGYPNLNKKELMSTNGWQNLPEKINRPLYMRNAFQQVLNFIEHNPDYTQDPGSTNLQRLEYLFHKFIDEFSMWLEKNEGKFDVNSLVDGIRKSVVERSIPTSTQLYEVLLVNLIHSHAMTTPGKTPSEPGSTPPEAA